MTQAEYDGTDYIRPKERGASRAWQPLYGYRWQCYSKARLRSHPLCVECLAAGRTTPATVTDHKTPHKGNVKLFWDKKNHQSLCASCHNTKTANEGAFGRGGRGIKSPKPGRS